MSDFTSNEDMLALAVVEMELPDEKRLELEAQFFTLSTGANVSQSPFRAKSSVLIGQPLVLDLETVLSESGQTLSTEMKLQIEHYQFYQVKLSCSFRAAANYRFSSAYFEVSLDTVPADKEKAIAYDLFPRSIEDEHKINRKFSFSPDLKFDLLKPLTSLLPKYESSNEYLSYVSNIEASGIMTTTPGWSFRRTDAHDIKGIQELFMLVRKPKDTSVKATFNLTGQIELLLMAGPIGPFPLTTTFRNSKFNNLEIDLC